MKIYLETMGCQMNRLDSELVASSLRAAGHDMVCDDRSADVVLYNTCSVRGQAENKVYSRLGAQGQRKASGRKVIVGVLGCLAQRQGERLLQEYPQVDLVCAPGQLESLAAMIEQAKRGHSTFPEPDQSPGETRTEKLNVPFSRRSRGVARLDPPRSAPRDLQADERLEHLDMSRDVGLTATPSQAMVRVARGCDKFCSYCIVPFVRGAEISRDPAHILDEVRRLVDSGRTEITLLGQTVNSYRWQGGGGAVRFSDLLALLAPLAGLRRLRFVTSHPIDFGDDILQAMRDLPNVCRYLHIPAQSGSDAVLARMNRKYTRAQYDQLVDRARAIVPEVVIAGDFIVGFPGETEADHAASAELIRRSGYKNSFIFKYSPRPGTAAAARMKDDVPTALKRFRNNDLLAVQAQVGLEHHQSYIGRTMELLVEGPSTRTAKQAKEKRGLSSISSAKSESVPTFQLMGRTRGDHIVVFDGPPSLANQYMDVRIVGASALTLFGEM
jgi:tRNA-2-methylthio-N6-dimethylallyladenosine synthase